MIAIHHRHHHHHHHHSSTISWSHNNAGNNNTTTGTHSSSSSRRRNFSITQSVKLQQEEHLYSSETHGGSETTPLSSRVQSLVDQHQQQEQEQEQERENDDGEGSWGEKEAEDMLERTVEEFIDMLRWRSDRSAHILDRKDLEHSHRQMVALVASAQHVSQLNRAMMCLRLYSALKQQVFERSVLTGGMGGQDSAAETEVLDAETYAQMIDVLSRNGFPEQVFEIFEEMKQVCSGESKRSERALAAAAEEDEDDRGSKFDLADALTDGDELMERLEEEEEDGVGAEWNEEDLLLEEAEENMPREILIPLFSDLTTYKLLIDACSAMGRTRDVEEIVLFMQTAGMPMNIDIYHAVMRGFVPSGMANDALRYYAQMTRTDEIEPTSETLSILLQVFFSAQDERYIQVYEGMLHQGVVPDADTYRNLLQCVCYVSKDLQGAKELIEEMRERGIQVTADDYCLLLDCCRLHGHDVEQAESVFYEMRESGIEPTMDAYNKLLRCMSNHGSVRTFQAFEDFRLEPGFSPDVDSYNAILEASVKSKNLERAKRILQQMRIHQVRPNVESHNLIFDFLYSKSWKPFLERLRNEPKKSIFADIMTQISMSGKVVKDRLGKSAETNLGQETTDVVDEDDEAFMFDMLLSDQYKDHEGAEVQDEATTGDASAVVKRSPAQDHTESGSFDAGADLDIDALMELLGTVEEEEEQASSVSTDEGHSTEEGTVLDESEGLQNKDEDEDDALFNQLVEEIEKRMK